MYKLFTVIGLQFNTDLNNKIHNKNPTLGDNFNEQDKEHVGEEEDTWK